MKELFLSAIELRGVNDVRRK